MKVIIASRIFTPEPSAASFMLEAIAQSLVSHGHEVEVVTSSLPTGFIEIQDSGYKISRAPVLRDRSGYLRGYLPYLSFDIPLFFRLIFRKKVDVYLIEPPPTSGAVMRVVSFLKRTPYVYDAADIWSDAAQMSTNNQLVLKFLRKLELFALAGASSILTISAGVAKRLRELGISREINVVGFGVDTHSFSYLDKATSSNPYFLYAGTFSEPHGAPLFIDAFAQFSQTHPEYSLVFVGNGTDREALVESAQSFGLSNVEVLNPVSPVELNTLLNGAVASLASLKPGTGYEYAFTTKIYASLAAGCPVIFAGEGPTKPFLDDLSQRGYAGWTVPYNADDLYDVMCAISSVPISNEQREQLSSFSSAQYSLTSIADSIVEVMNRVGKS